ncbi:MAG: radical SAM protein [Calditrichaeota bacterium]|nr:radical SAM protein [Calditrichota bacterium]
MKIVLIQPPVEDFYSTPVRLQPIGLAYLKAAIKKYFPEIEVIIKDYHHGYQKRSIPLPEELLFLREYYPYPDRSPFSTFYHYYRFGASYDKIISDLAQMNPDLIGVPVLFTAYAPQALMLAEIIKKKLQIPVLLGGSHVSAMPRKVLEHPFVDFAIRGEGERPMVEFIDQWLGKKKWEKVPNLGFKSGDSNIRLNEAKANFPLEEIPFPDLSDFKPENYRYGKSNLCFVISSRSCPYRCAFCSVHKTFGDSFRLRSVENIVEELEMRYDQGYSVFDFEDDNLSFDLKRFERLNRALISNFRDKKVKFMAMNGLSYFRLSADILPLMYKAGFRDLNISLVSINTGLLSRLKRPHNLARYKEVAEEAERLGMSVISYQILGLPGDTLSSMVDTLIFHSRLRVKVGASPFYVTPDMPLYRQISKKSKWDWVNGRLTTLGAVDDKSMRDGIYTLFILSRMVNFLKALPGIDGDVSFAEILADKDRLDKRTRLGLEILERLIKEKRLFAAAGNEFKELKRFDFALFREFWDKIGFIKSMSKGKIYIENY